MKEERNQPERQAAPHGAERQDEAKAESRAGARAREADPDRGETVEAANEAGEPTKRATACAHGSSWVTCCCQTTSQLEPTAATRG